MEISLGAVGKARAVLIAGPTASGKSAAALALAEAVAESGRAAWIVNADAMQVYDALQVLTARPTKAEEGRVPHRLFGTVPAATRHSVGAWLADLKGVLEDAEDAGALAILTGGTGLYFRAATEGLADIPAIPREVRERFATHLEAEGVERLHALLAERDPESAASIRPRDRQRILRALEVLEATGRPLSEWQKLKSAPPIVAADTPRYVIEPERSDLYRRIEARFDRMMQDGALDEVRALLALDLDPELPAMKAIGVRPLAAHLRGEISLAEAVAAAKTETRRFAKRQATWFRTQTPDWPRIRSASPYAERA
jgi:tRNA dimethylallyltransferase